MELVLAKVRVTCLEFVRVYWVPINEQVLNVATVSGQVGQELVEGSDGQASVLQSETRSTDRIGLTLKSGCVDTPPKL